MAINADIVSLDAHLGGAQARDTNWQVYDSLTRYDSQLQPQPWLAESWDVNSDYTQIKFNLRKNVEYHSGREFTSDDVKYNIIRGRSPDVAVGAYVADSTAFTDIQTPDKYTIILKADAPRPGMFGYFHLLKMLDKDIMEGPDAKTKANGTGPFTFVEWVPGDHLTFAKNKNYWQSGRPYIDELFVPIITDTQAMVSHLETGAIDVANRPSLTDAVRLQTDTAYSVVRNSVSGAYHMFPINTTFPPLDKKEVRQALNYAIDRQRIVQTARLGFGQPEALPWAATSPFYEPARNGQYAFDLDKAKSLLNGAGISNLEMDQSYQNTVPEFQNYALIYQSDLAKIGVKLNLKPLDSSVWFDQAAKLTYQGTALSQNSQANFPPSFFFTGQYFRIDKNWEGFQSDAYTRITTALLSEPDPAKQKVLGSQINDILLDESFVMPIASTPPYVVTRANVHGLGYSAIEDLDYFNVWIS